MNRLILGKHLLRLKVRMFDLHYKCRYFKNENTNVSFHYLKNFIQKLLTGYAVAETMEEMQSFYMKLGLNFFLC